jgi:SAM-dependent methyltransferase
LNDQVVNHYTSEDLGQRIINALEQVTGGNRPPTIDDLAPVDEFHIGGRSATARLFEQVGLSSDDRVLDVGSGIGGTSRFVAQTFGCQIEGIDLTPEFCEVATQLSELVGLGDKVTFQSGSALNMPFEDESFDAAYMLHVGMNIEDKATLFSEVNRVLRPGGKYAVYDVLRGSGEGTFQFPVPWATESEESFVASADEMTGLLQDAGFEINTVTDRTDSALEFFASLTPNTGDTPPPIGLHLILGPDAKTKLGNMVINVKNSLCGPWEIIAQKTVSR